MSFVSRSRLALGTTTIAVSTRVLAQRKTYVVNWTEYALKQSSVVSSFVAKCPRSETCSRRRGNARASERSGAQMKLVMETTA